ncbi:MAG: SH3 domain-containing protein [Pseudomonadota bacterium]
MAYLAAFLVTLVLAAWLTPARWWKRPTARGLAILAGGTWAIGSAVLAYQGKPLVASGSFLVYHDLNLRSGSGVQSARLAVVPAGSTVIATGKHDGDWWELQVARDGKMQIGWASSLWLRRAQELR